MQFIENGPDIPDELLQAQEEGRVVLFCGAGISYPAGLPDFKGLVDDIYSLVGTKRTEIEQAAYSRDLYDRTLDLLEQRLPGRGRLAVRKTLLQALNPKMHREGAADTHTSLLELARNREGMLRLVTTNFDRIFVRVAKHITQPVNAYLAPMLPIPKNTRWNGLVYLHGILPEREDESALNQLVLSSGDFGLAYLTDRWAARFVSELFRNYVVCFVGYSINDPVLRYMMDALAADRMLGEVTPRAYAFGDCEPGQEAVKTIEWNAKGVSPVLYEVSAQTQDHSALHRTLKAWAETYRDGVLGKEAIVVNYALARPSASTRQDDFVGRMLWALSDESGLPAKRLAEFNPVPPLEWLEAFSEDRYRHNDLQRFGVRPPSEIDDKFGFSLIRRPASYTRAPWMSFVSSGATQSEWDEVMSHLARWLVRHLDDPKLILWLSKRGGRLHERMAWLIEDQLNRFAKLDLEGRTAELEEIRANSPNAVPQPLMRTLWRLLLTGHVKSPGRDLDLYLWKDRFKRDGVTTTLRLQLRGLLSPKIVLREPFRSFLASDKNGAPEGLKQLVDWELVLETDAARSSIKDLLANSNDWHDALPFLLDDFQRLLLDALDLFRELDNADDQNDRSVFDLPSISPHRQNRYSRDWVVLIELLRDAWQVVKETNPGRASRLAIEWFSLPYPTFKRLALFAASNDGCIPTDIWVEWLVTDESWWFWSVHTHREIMRLLSLQGDHLTHDARAKLEAAILAGPPRDMYRDDLEPERWNYHLDRDVWLRLAKLRQGGGDLGHAALQQLNNLSATHPEWALASNERDEFLRWMSGTGDPDFEASCDEAPLRRREMVAWLKHQSPVGDPFHQDTWRERCRTRFFHSAYALCDLAQEDLWPPRHWREAFQAWSEEARILRSWRFVAPLVQTMPDAVLQEVSHSITWWLEAVSRLLDRHEAIFVDISRRVLALAHEEAIDTGDPVGRAINHPVGHVTEALLNLWFKRRPNDNDKLPDDLRPFFTQLCDVQEGRFRHGRVLLASQLIALFRVDRAWTEANLLPPFDWNNNPMEAKAVWQGFLRSPRLYRPLLVASKFKAPFLDTAHHYAQLGEHGDHFAAFLTYAALDPAESYTRGEFQAAFRTLPQDALEEAAQALVRALEGAGEQREGYWENRIQPFWQDIWPKSRDLVSNSIAESLARLSIAAGGEFPSAVSAVLDWLQPIKHPHRVVTLLEKSGLAKRFPEDALRFLNAVLNDQPWVPKELNQCLDAISKASPSLDQDHRYRRLVEYSRRRGG